MGMAGMIESVRWRWIAFFGAISAAWALLFVMEAATADFRALAAVDPGFWAMLCRAAVEDASFLGLFAMWALMSAAMMAPTAVPAFKTYDDLTHTTAANNVGFMALIAGYGLAWLVFAALGAGLQMALVEVDLVDPWGRSTAFWLNAGLLALAGAYQFSPVKAACLAKCRTPMMFFLSNWHAGSAGALRMGLTLGAVCVGCCWALMLLGFVGGLMSLAWMGAATVLMGIEKVPDIGRHLTVPLGVLLLVAAAWFAVEATYLTPY